MDERRPTSAATARWRRTAQVLKALGHPSRLFLVDRLARGECCVCELTTLVGADVSTVSRHLAVLRDAGIVADERRGSQVFYRIAAPGASDLLRRADEVVLLALEREETLTGLLAGPGSEAAGAQEAAP